MLGPYSDLFLVIRPEGVVNVEVNSVVFNKASLNGHNFSSVGPITLIL